MAHLLHSYVRLTVFLLGALHSDVEISKQFIGKILTLSLFFCKFGVLKFKNWYQKSNYHFLETITRSEKEIYAKISFDEVIFPSENRLFFLIGSWSIRNGLLLFLFSFETFTKIAATILPELRVYTG